jgi:hypothetical protein
MLGSGAGIAPSSFIGAIGFILLLGLFVISSFIRRSRAQSRLRLVGDEVSPGPRSYGTTATACTEDEWLWRNQATVERARTAVSFQPAPRAPPYVVQCFEYP